MTKKNALLLLHTPAQNSLFASHLHLVPTQIMLNHILKVSDSIAVEPYDDVATALQLVIPQQLKMLISLSEQVPVSMPVRNIINEKIIPAYKETLSNVEIFARNGDYAYAADIIIYFRCEVEIARLFFEGIYRYMSSCDSGFSA